MHGYSFEKGEMNAFIQSTAIMDKLYFKRPRFFWPYVRLSAFGGGKEWTLPNLRQLQLGGVGTTHITVNYVLATSVGVDGGGQVHQISLNWKNERRCAKVSDFGPRGLLLQVSKEKALFLDVKDCATKLRVAAPLAIKMHLKVCCGAWKELEIDCPLLLNLVVENPPPTMRKTAEEPKSPWLKEVTVELLPKNPFCLLGFFWGFLWVFLSLSHFVFWVSLMSQH